MKTTKESNQATNQRKGGEMTTITIEARIPTNPEYYGSETSGVEAEDLAKGVKEIYEDILPRWFPNAEISVCLVPEISSFGNQTRVYVEGVEDDVETEMEILRAVERDVKEAEEIIWSSFCHNNLQVKPTIDHLVAKMETQNIREREGIEAIKGGEMKYTKVQVITGLYAREAKFYLGSQFILDRDEEEYDDGFWIIPEGDYAEWYNNFEALYRALEEAEPLE